LASISKVRPYVETRSLAEFNANNALSLHKLRQEGSVKIQKFNDRAEGAAGDQPRSDCREWGRRASWPWS
jgi:hypothetical protein